MGICRNTCVGRKLGARDPIKKERETKPSRLGRPVQNGPPRKEQGKHQETREKTTTFPERELYVDNKGPSGGDSHRAARIAEIREAHDISLKEVIEVDAMEDTPLIQFGRAERSGPRTSHNALVITAYWPTTRWDIFIDLGISADILFGEGYDQMQLGNVSLEKLNTSLYGFAGEVVHPRGMISLPLTMGAGTIRKTCMLKFLVVDVPSAYNVILGRPTLTAFPAVISIYHMKIKFTTPGGVGEVQGDPLQSRKGYIETVRKG
ncbi:UNVERIFIED_CONTAM: hypothetical protein Sradi_3015900 [Sesamum radiatum]|uniref:Uncharacterized protein n=1 Tax=Sesamum radiatum TaxID=300843 RepID=A0AAW2S3C9_SESRA